MAEIDDWLGAKLSRRALMGSIAALQVSPAIALPRIPLAAGFARVRPGTAAWPSASEWTALSREVGGRLISGERSGTPAPPELLSNPFYVRDQVGLTQSSGWFGAWRSEPSIWAVEAASASDVAAAVRFAKRHRVRLVVKGGGHSYVGGSCAPDSLLVWTRVMNQIRLHDAFIPEGSDSPPVSAVTVGAGCIWLDVYQKVCVDAGRYVQGGGCTTVGVAGLIQGGGFGSFSKCFGLAAASLLEVEIVTADGMTRVVNAVRDPDLFWAIKGGGGGTFGIVTQLTLRTHDLPKTFGAVRLVVQATSDTAFRTLLAVFLKFYRESLFNKHWGEQVRATPDRKLVIEMVFQGLEGARARAAWNPFLEEVKGSAKDWKTIEQFVVLDVPGRRFWDSSFLSSHIPQAIRKDDRPGSRPHDYWWAGDGEQVGAYWSAYCSAWLPSALLDDQRREGLANAWSEASLHWPVSFHFNKGLAGADPDVIAESRATAMNPEVADAFALAIIAGAEAPAYPGWAAPDLTGAEVASSRIRAADRALRTVAPNVGSYMSECDYFLHDWKRASWGPHWPRLDAIKERYDPDGLFILHHGIGSERWSRDGFTRLD